MRRSLFMVFLVVAAALGFTAPVTGQTLTIAQDIDPADLYGSRSTNNPMFPILESLYLDNPHSGEIEPLLALEHEMVSDTEVLIKLREGVNFTNGEKMNAEAVAHSIKLFADPKTVPAYGIYASAIDTAEPVDEYTVRVLLKKPSPIVTLLLAQVLVIPPKYWEEVGPKEFGQKPIGTGQFVLTEWLKDDRIVMDINADYWGEPPQGFDQLVWRTVPEASSRAAGLKTGEFDLAIAIPAIDAIEIEGLDDVSIYSGDVSRVFQLTLSSLPEHETPIQNKLVRQALNYAVDKEAIINSLFFGKAEPLNGQVLRKSQLGFNPDLQDYPYDPEKAKAMLAEAGYPDGFTIPFKFPSGRYAQDREVSEAVAGMLSKVGVKTEMIALEPGEFLRQLRSKELAPMYFVGLAPQDDPAFQASQYVSTWRYTPIANEEIDALAEAGAKEMDVEKRRKIYQDMMALMHEEAPIIFLYDGIDVYGTDARLQNFLPRGDGRMFFYDVSYGQ